MTIKGVVISFVRFVLFIRGRRKTEMRIQFLNKTSNKHKTGYVDYFVKMNKTTVDEKVG